MRKRKNHRLFSALLGGSGWSAALSGVLILAWGYVHREGAPWYLDLAVLVLAIVVPLLFLVSLAGIYVKLRAQAGWLSLLGFVTSFAGAAWWLIPGVREAPNLYRQLGERTWPTAPARVQEECGLCLLAKLYVLLDSPLNWLLVGLSIVGLATVRREVVRNWGLLLLATALFGWVWQLTDDRDGIVDVRPVHVAFGILFSLGWVLLGYALWTSKNKAS